ncbi:MAG: pyridoxamine 5'-phosphate oxidase family protein [Candidatus Binatia bacterium]
MAQRFERLLDEHIDFIGRQKVFFVATAPVEGRINLSPKGMDTLRCLDDHTVAYLDLTGSGNETAAHLEENGRMTLMFCSFDSKAAILRLYGSGRVLRPRDDQWRTMLGRFDAFPGTRQIMVMTVDAVQTSCGYAVPRYEFHSHRDTLKRWAERKGEQGLRRYWRDHNRFSIDGLPTAILEK